jgi:hypothetical protein
MGSRRTFLVGVGAGHGRACIQELGGLEVGHDGIDPLGPLRVLAARVLVPAVGRIVHQAGRQLEHPGTLEGAGHTWRLWKRSSTCNMT